MSWAKRPSIPKIFARGTKLADVPHNFRGITWAQYAHLCVDECIRNPVKDPEPEAERIAAAEVARPVFGIKSQRKVKRA